MAPPWGFEVEVKGDARRAADLLETGRRGFADEFRFRLETASPFSKWKIQVTPIPLRKSSRSAGRRISEPIPWRRLAPTEI
jgi:hypothetical protein